MLNAAPRGIGAKQQRSERTIAIIGVPFCDTQSAYIHTRYTPSLMIVLMVLRGDAAKGGTPAHVRFCCSMLPTNNLPFVDFWGGDGQGVRSLPSPRVTVLRCLDMSWGGL